MHLQNAGTFSMRSLGPSQFCIVRARMGTVRRGNHHGIAHGPVLAAKLWNARPADSTIHTMSSELPNYEQAAAKVAAYARKLRQHVQPSIETVALSSASGRVLARPLVADRDQPPFPRSTRDGFACRAAEANQHMPCRSPVRSTPASRRRVRCRLNPCGRS